MQPETMRPVNPALPPPAPRRLALLPWVVLIMLLGSLTTSLLSYLVSRQAVRQGIAQQTLPLTGDTIYSKVQKDILQPVLISSEMANNTFLRDWLLDGERDPNDVARYLKAIQSKHQAVTAFVASERTLRYYHPGGLLTTLDPTTPRDAWYDHVRQLSVPYEANVGLDSTNHNLPTIYIDYRMLDSQGHFIGVTGVGLTLKNVQQVVQSYEKNFQRRIVFVDKAGKVTLSGSPTPAQQGSLKTMPGLSGLADQILGSSSRPVGLEYRLNGSVVQVNSRFIPELNWFLVVEQPENLALQPLKRVFLLNLLISGLATALVLSLIIPALRRFQQRLERAASIDGLTGLVNRQAFDLQFEAHVRDTQRNPAPFAGVLFDIDLFKQINDTFGHPTGDAVLRQVARLARQTVRENDLVARWGGEEFMILLKGCHLDEAQVVANKLRQAIESHEFGFPGLRVTISSGVTVHREGESAEEFLLRVDQALYRAKEDGRNRVQTNPVIEEN